MTRRVRRRRAPAARARPQAAPGTGRRGSRPRARPRAPRRSEPPIAITPWLASRSRGGRRARARRWRRVPPCRTSRTACSACRRRRARSCSETAGCRARRRRARSLAGCGCARSRRRPAGRARSPRACATRMMARGPPRRRRRRRRAPRSAPGVEVAVRHAGRRDQEAARATRHETLPDLFGTSPAASSAWRDGDDLGAQFSVVGVIQPPARSG